MLFKSNSVITLNDCGVYFQNLNVHVFIVILPYRKHLKFKVLKSSVLEKCFPQHNPYPTCAFYFGGGVLEGISNIAGNAQSYFWLWVQGSFLTVLGGPDVAPGIEPGLLHVTLYCVSSLPAVFMGFNRHCREKKK